VRLWMSFAPRQGASRRVQIAAIVMLIVVLFPVISVTDDLQAAQTFAEDESYLRRDHAAASPHVVLPGFSALPVSFSVEIRFAFLGSAAPGSLSVRAAEKPALTAIQNRPPPAA
jgi:hypothetical protein